MARPDACHIDVDGAETASAAVVVQLAASDLVSLSKFGKLEAAKRGLFGAFELAMSLGKPILTTVSARHLAAWRAFAPDASVLEASDAGLQAWWMSVGSRA